MQDENSEDGDDDDVDFHDDFNFKDQEKVQRVLSRLKENSDHRSFLKWRDDARPHWLVHRCTPETATERTDARKRQPEPTLLHLKTIRASLLSLRQL